MTRKFAYRLSLLFAVLALMLTCLTLFTFAQDDDMGEAETDTNESESVDLSVYDTGEIEIAIEPTGENGYCTICHNQPGRTLRLQDGTQLNLYVAPELLAASVHGPSEGSPGLGCLDCHGEDSFPHVGLPPADGRAYTINANSMCTSCHETHAEELEMGLHAQAISNGNTAAAVCTDCHGAHHIQTAEFRPEIMSEVCGDCHETTLDQWQMTDHADIGQLGCAVCHNYHTQTLRIGETTTDLCLNCHEDNLPDLFVHQTHITARQGSDHPVECADCHMTPHTLDSNRQLIEMELDSEPLANHSMLLDATPCNECHTDLVSSGAWDDIMAERIGLETSPDEELIEAPANSEQVANDQSRATRLAIQGLVLGLGLGVTFTIVFVTRNRQ